MTVTETRLFLPCGCAGNCTVLAVDRWDDGDLWFEIYTRANEGASLWWRIKTAVKVLLRRDHYFDALCFTDTEIQALRDFIDGPSIAKPYEALAQVRYWAGECRREAQQMMLANERIAPDVVARYFEAIENIINDAAGEQS